MASDAELEAFPQLEATRRAALKALGDVRPVSGGENYGPSFGQRTEAGRKLPEPYLIHFLLIDLLKFPASGQEEKVAWTIPIQVRDRRLAIEYRKLGVGVFGADNELAREVVERVLAAVKVARPFFDWLASRAVEQSRVNVVNHAWQLFSRFEFFLRSYRAKRDEANADEKRRFELQEEAGWLAMGAVESFFGWTEHVFVLLAILTEKAVTGLQVTELAESNWPTKFKAVLDINDATTKRLFDDLMEIRRELRNFMAHGTFGKDGRAFDFHSSAGAAPVMLPHRRGTRRFIVEDARHFDHEATLGIIETFIAHLWSGERSPARIYIQDSGLALVLTMASDGTYAGAMCSDDDMQQFVNDRQQLEDMYANMDW